MPPQPGPSYVKLAIKRIVNRTPQCRQIARYDKTAIKLEGKQESQDNTVFVLMCEYVRYYKWE